MNKAELQNKLVNAIYNDIVGNEDEGTFNVSVDNEGWTYEAEGTYCRDSVAIQTLRKYNDDVDEEAYFDTEFDVLELEKAVSREYTSYITEGEAIEATNESLKYQFI